MNNALRQSKRLKRNLTSKNPTAGGLLNFREMDIDKKLKWKISAALSDAKHLKAVDIGFVARDLNDGMVCKIWYRTIGDRNRMVKYEVVTSEEWAWEKAGCSNAEEYRAYLNRQMWVPEFSAGLNL